MAKKDNPFKAVVRQYTQDDIWDWRPGPYSQDTWGDRRKKFVKKAPRGTTIYKRIPAKTQQYKIRKIKDED